MAYSHPHPYLRSRCRVQRPGYTVSEGRLEADLNANRFSWSVDWNAVAEAKLFDGQLVLFTNARILASLRESQFIRASRISSTASVS